MATPRSNSACTFGSQEVGKLSVPSFSSPCCPEAPTVSSAVMRPAAHSVRLDCLFIACLPFGSPMTAAICCKHSSFLLASPVDLCANSPLRLPRMLLFNISGHDLLDPPLKELLVQGSLPAFLQFGWRSGHVFVANDFRGLLQIWSHRDTWYRFIASSLENRNS